MNQAASMQCKTLLNVMLLIFTEKKQQEMCPQMCTIHEVPDECNKTITVRRGCALPLPKVDHGMAP